MSSAFWSGFMAETTDILEEVDERNYDAISRSLDYQAKDISESRAKRRELQTAYNIAATNLADLEGMDDEKINLVLSKGLDKANEFLSDAPKFAKARGISVGEMLEVTGSGEAITPSDLISSGQLVDMPAVRTFQTPEGLGSSYTSTFERQAELLRASMGIDDEQEVTEVNMPQGRIKVDLFSEPTTPEYQEYTKNQVWKGVQSMMAADAGVKLIELNGVVMATSETQSKKDQIDRQWQRWGKYYDLATRRLAQVPGTSQSDIIEIAYGMFVDELKAEYGGEYEAIFGKVAPKKTETLTEGGNELPSMGQRVITNMDENLLSEMLNATNARDLVVHLITTEGLSRAEAEKKAREMRQEHRNNR